MIYLRIWSWLFMAVALLFGVLLGFFIRHMTLAEWVVIGICFVVNGALLYLSGLAEGMADAEEYIEKDESRQ